MEKPDVRRAAQYLRRGYLWNAGMFIARRDVFRAAFAEHAPDLLPLASVRTTRSLRAVYEPLPRISFDQRGNVREGPCNVVESDGNICVAKSASISLLGVRNLVVVTTPDAVLVADKSRLSDMKLLFRQGQAAPR